MNARRLLIAAIAAGVIALAGSTGLGSPWSTGAQPGAGELVTTWQLLPRAPHGGRLIVTVTNNSSQVRTGVGIKGTLPDSLTMAGPRAFSLDYQCANALTANSTVCQVVTDAPDVVFLASKWVGETLGIENEHLLVTGAGPGSADLAVARGVNGTQAAAHAAGSGLSRMDVSPEGAQGTQWVCQHLSGVPRTVDCWASLPPGGWFSVTVDVGRAPASLGAVAVASLSVPAPQSTIMVDFRWLDGVFQPDVGPWSQTLMALASDGPR